MFFGGFGKALVNEGDGLLMANAFADEYNQMPVFKPTSVLPA